MFGGRGVVPHYLLIACLKCDLKGFGVVQRQILPAESIDMVIERDECSSLRYA